MMKRNFILIFTFLWSLFSAQLDTDHWFAPMAAKAGTGGFTSYLYLSTNEVTPFTVSIYNDNSLYTTIQISKGNPAQVYIPAGLMMGIYQSELFIPSQKGLNVKGAKKFFANYRFSIPNHAEIITSKGLAGLGTTFYAAMAANTGTAAYVNSTIGVIATEDNTVVTVSGYNPNVIFSDGTSSPTKVFTLNKGQSYILDAISSTSLYNQDGLIGAKISATKPISVTNGNFNGIYTNQNFSNNDILMDQAVPVERLGNNFVVVKGNAPVSSGMEALLVVATQDNTQITVNGNPTGITLNEGDYTMIDGNNYVHQGNNNYNMSVSTSKNVYVYQLLGGTSSGSVHAAGGFNYIPPLSCFLPNKVDEIGFINSIGSTAYNTKLNIITQTGASVTLNGTPIPTVNGPYPVAGNADWVTYSVPNVTGTVTVQSTKSVTAGIAGGSGAVGYGGYFAGFSSVPVIVKTGDCYAGILLQVDNSYDAYQWYLNGNPIPGANNYTINPELYGAGNYTVLITKNNCESKLTEVYQYTLCPPLAVHQQTMGSCNSLQIFPVFTNSSQTVVPSLTQIIAPPAIGNVSVNSTSGVITYTPPAGLTADAQTTFVYYIQAAGTNADFEYVRVNIDIDVLQTTNASITSCGDANGNGLFDLTSVSVTPDPAATVTYFTNSNLTGAISNPTSYQGTAGIVYANVTSSFGCSKMAEIQLTVNPSPNITASNFNGILCDDDFDGTISVDFQTITPQIVTNANLFNVKYYTNQADANAGNNNNLPNNWSFSTATTVYVRVESAAGNCPPALDQINFSFENRITPIVSNHSAIVCDADGNGSESVNLSTYQNAFTADPSVTFSYHNSLANAQNNVNALPATQTITGTATYFIRLQHPTECVNVVQLNLNLETIQMTAATLTSCETTAGNGVFNLTSANVTTNTGVTYSYFSNAALTNVINNPTNYTSANATVYVRVTSSNSCSAVTTIALSVIPSPNINTGNFNGLLCDNNFDGNIEVNFNSVTPQIVNNANLFTVRYYLSQADANAGNNNTLPANWSYSSPTTVYVRVDAISGNCTAVFGQISFGIGEKIPLLIRDGYSELCDDNLDGVLQVNLNSYKNLFTANPAVAMTFYLTLADAQNAANAISSTQTLTGLNEFYVRFESNSGCPNTAKLSLKLKVPKESATLTDQIICPGGTTILDAGPGFSKYLWSTGAVTPSINAGVGNYYVDLNFDGCVYRQYVTVSPSVAPVIDKIEIKGTTATVFVSGATAPYQYSLDGIKYQSSNVFNNLPKGPHTVYVISAEKCIPVTQKFLILNLINAITPNSDGINDVLDYSDLKAKSDVSIEIYDRYGKRIFSSDSNNYIWNGTRNGYPLSTGTYWYILKWREPGTVEKVEYHGWVLLKNRE